VSCAMCGSFNPSGGTSAQMYQPHPSSSDGHQAPYQPSPAPEAPRPPQQYQQQQQQQYQLMRSPIPNGMQPGQQLQVRVGPAGNLMVVTIPDRRSWIMATSNVQASFEFKIPINPSPDPPIVGAYVPQGTNQNNTSQQQGSQSYHGMNQNNINQQQGSQAHDSSDSGSNATSRPTMHRQEWQSFETFNKVRYQPPPLR